MSNNNNNNNNVALTLFSTSIILGSATIIGMTVTALNDNHSWDSRPNYSFVYKSNAILLTSAVVVSLASTILVGMKLFNE